MTLSHSKTILLVCLVSLVICQAEYQKENQKSSEPNYLVDPFMPPQPEQKSTEYGNGKKEGEMHKQKGEKNLRDKEMRGRNHKREGASQNQPNIDQIYQQVAGIMMVAAICLTIASISISIGLLYMCIKKRVARNKIKHQMQSLQNLYANSHNMNAFQMNAQPNFPKTIHI